MIYFTDMRVAGLLPEFFNLDDPRSAREQLHENYAHGGGVHPQKGFKLAAWNLRDQAILEYPGDPLLHEISRAKLRDEIIILFPYSWVAIVQPDGKYIVTRCD